MWTTIKLLQRKLLWTIVTAMPVHFLYWNHWKKKYMRIGSNWIEMSYPECEGGCEGFGPWTERPVIGLLMETGLLICGMSEPEHPCVTGLSIYWKASHTPIPGRATRAPAASWAGCQPPDTKASPPRGEGDRRTMAWWGTGSMCEIWDCHRVMHGICEMWPPLCSLLVMPDDMCPEQSPQ